MCECAVGLGGHQLLALGRPRGPVDALGRRQRAAVEGVVVGDGEDGHAAVGEHGGHRVGGHRVPGDLVHRHHRGDVGRGLQIQ